MTRTTDTTAIFQELTINAPAARVFAALTEPTQVTRWWGSEGGYQSTEMTRDLRVGGVWRTTGLTREGNPFVVHGEYRAIDPPRLLEYTWNHDWDEGGASTETLVRFELEEHDGVTKLRLMHSGFTAIGERNGHNEGWTRVLGLLANYVEQSQKS